MLHIVECGVSTDSSLLRWHLIKLIIACKVLVLHHIVVIKVLMQNIIVGHRRL